MATKYEPDAGRVLQFANELSGPRALDPADGQSDCGVSRSSEIEVRQFRLSDSSALEKFPHRYELRHPESDDDRPGMLKLAIRRILSGDNTRRPLFVARNTVTRQRLGILQCVQNEHDDRWYLHYLASQECASRTNSVHIALLEHAIGQAGWHGARRLMARSDINSPLTGTLRSVGFSAFAREAVFALALVPEGTASKRVRMQEQSDVWSVHQLYLQTTPVEVQNAEALTSHFWDIDLEDRSRRGWFIPSDSGAAAFVRVRTTHRYHLLEPMFLPGFVTLMPELLRAVFAALNDESLRTVYVLLRGYHRELTSVLEALGFDFTTDQFLMVRYTTVSVPVSVRFADAFGRLRATEPDAQRVPSFYVRDMHD